MDDPLQKIIEKAQLLIDREEVEPALNLLLEARRRYAETTDLLLAEAHCLALLDRKEEALALCDRIVETDPRDSVFILKARLLTTPTDPAPAPLPDAEKHENARTFVPDPHEETPTPPSPSPLTIYTTFFLGGLLTAVGAVIAGLAFSRPGIENTAPPFLFPAVVALTFFLMNLFGAWAVSWSAWWRRPGIRWESPLSLIDDALPAAVLMSFPMIGPPAAVFLLRRKIGWDSAIHSALLLAILQLGAAIFLSFAIHCI